MSRTRRLQGFTLVETMMSLIITGIVMATLLTIFMVSARAFRTSAVQVGPTNAAESAIASMDRDFREATACTLNNPTNINQTYWITLTEPMKDANGMNTLGTGTFGTTTVLNVQSNTVKVHYFQAAYVAPAANAKFTPAVTGSWLYRATGAPNGDNTFTYTNTNPVTPVLRGGLQSGNYIFSAGSAANPNFVSVICIMTPDSTVAPVTNMQGNLTVSSQLLLRNISPM